MTTGGLRVVVTGLGLVSPLGVGVDRVWPRLCAGASGIRTLCDDLVPDVPAKVAGTVPTVADDPEAGFDPDAVVPAKDRKKMDRFIQFAIAAAGEAIGQAQWRPETERQRARTATVIASGIGGFHAISQAVNTTEAQGVRRLSPFTVPSFLVNLAAGWISILHGFKGPLGAPVTACAAGVQAVGDAARMIRAGEADVAVCGGAEACISRVSLGGFAASRALSTRFNDDPVRASRPFDHARDGFVMGEGAGILALEALDHARQRGARPIAEVLGYGTSADAYHLTGAPDDGEGAARAMRTALAQGGIDPAQVCHINAHATSTPLGDRAELAAIRSVFGADGGPAVSSTKSATGHLLGAAGGIEAIFAVLALRDGVVQPSLNLDRPDAAAADLDLVANTARPAPLRHVLSNGFGFGGVNASVLFGLA